MIPALTKRMIRETDPRLLIKFLYAAGWKGRRAVNKFRKKAETGNPVPAFLFISVTNRCNLSCQGCWVSSTNPSQSLPPEKLDEVITQSKSYESSFFGILGGEPLLYEGLFDIIARHPDCYFQLFTNGLLLDDATAEKMRELGNVTPLISVEGREAVSDVRRGGKNVYTQTMDAIAACRRHKLVTGVATSVCKSNIDDLVSYDFIADLVQQGAHYLWYYIYRPVGSNPAPELALSQDEIIRLRRFMVDARCTEPIVIIDAYWDHDGNALCPAATGISHHLNPAGDIEPCPPIQFSCDNISDEASVIDILENSTFLQDFHDQICSTTRGCVLLENPSFLKSFLESHNAGDTSGRGTAYEELAAMTPRPDHHIPGRQIPEKHWLYRYAKKNWFFGFGAYG